MNKGFLTKFDYDPKLTPFWELSQFDKKQKKSLPMSKEAVNDAYIEYAAFYLYEYGVFNGKSLNARVQDWQNPFTEMPKLLNRVEGTTLATFQITKEPRLWQHDPNISSAKNEGLYRVLYTNGDDDASHALFATESAALECFNFIRN